MCYTSGRSVYGGGVDIGGGFLQGGGVHAGGGLSVAAVGGGSAVRHVGSSGVGRNVAVPSHRRRSAKNIFWYIRPSIINNNNLHGIL